jgi:hypothetical protein
MISGTPDIRSGGMTISALAKSMAAGFARNAIRGD